MVYERPGNSSDAALISVCILKCYLKRVNLEELIVINTAYIIIVEEEPLGSAWRGKRCIFYSCSHKSVVKKWQKLQETTTRQHLSTEQLYVLSWVRTLWLRATLYCAEDNMQNRVLQRWRYTMASCLYIWSFATTCACLSQGCCSGFVYILPDCSALSTLANRDIRFITL